MMKMNEKEVKTKADFIVFLNELSKNHKSSMDEWKNKRLDGFLNAMAVWVEDREAFNQSNNVQEPPDIPWGFIANMFLAAKIYE